MEKWTLTWTKLARLDDTTLSSLSDRIPGVYRLSYKADDGNYYVFYIGQAEDIKVRLQQHLSSSESNVCIKNYCATKSCFFRFSKITQADLRNAVEKIMYKHYQPACNITEPEGRNDIEVNLN